MQKWLLKVDDLRRANVVSDIVEISSRLGIQVFCGYNERPVHAASRTHNGSKFHKYYAEEEERERERERESTALSVSRGITYGYDGDVAKKLRKFQSVSRCFCARARDILNSKIRGELNFANTDISLVITIVRFLRDEFLRLPRRRVRKQDIPARSDQPPLNLFPSRLTRSECWRDTKEKRKKRKWRERENQRKSRALRESVMYLSGNNFINNSE